MRPDEIQIGELYSFGGQTRYPKRVVKFDPDKWPERGGFVVVRTVRPDGSEGQNETCAGNYIAERATPIR